MKNSLSVFLVLVTFLSCSKSVHPDFQHSSGIEMETLVEGDFSVRAIQIDGDKVWFGANKGKFGWINFNTREVFQDAITPEKNPEFRSIASNSEAVFFLNVGSPANLYKINKENLAKKIVYTENDKNTFYDSMKFWNEKEGIAIGDPTENCFSILITKDGGGSWQKLSCENLPKLIEGEAAFAASNTNVIVHKNKTWIVSGGKKARVFYSPNKGKSWQVYNTPIVQGEAMTGIFSGDFYDEKIGFVVGGDFENKEQNSGNKALTKDGGKTWELVSENSGFGYAECVQFVPNSKGKQLVTVGHSGINYSADFGKTWINLSRDSSFSTIRFVNNSTAIVAGKGKIVKIKFKK